MTQNAEQPSIDELKARRERLGGDLAEARKAHKSALDAFDKVRGDKDVSTEALLEAAGKVKDAESGVSRVEGQIATATKAVERAEFEERSAELNEGTATLSGEFGKLVAAMSDLFSRFGVETLSYNIKGLDTESPESTLRVAGPGIPKAPSRGGGGGGSRAKHTVTADGVEMSTRDYVLAHIDEASPAVRAYLEGDTSRSVNVSHDAERIAKKLGHTYN